MKSIILKNIDVFHEATNGGKSAIEAKEYIENGELWKAHIILRGLGLDCDNLLITKKTKFERIVKDNNLFIKVTVSPLGNI